MNIRLMAKKLIEAVQVPRNFVWCLLHGLPFDSSWRFYGLPIIRAAGRGSRIRIGCRLTLVSTNSRNTFCVSHPVSIRTSCAGGDIEIGDDVGMSGCAISAKESIRIGNRVLIGAGAIIADNDSHPLEVLERRAGGEGASKPVVIEDDVFIGARAIILKGVTIGRGSVIGAGSVVSKNVPPFCVVAGNPARVVKRLKEVA